MTKYNPPLDLGKEQILRLPASLTVIAASEHIEDLRAKRGSSWIGDADLHALPLTDRIPESMLEKAGIVVVHVDPNVPVSMGRIEQIHSLRPEAAQIVALDKADMRLVRTLVREGVADVVEIPLDPEEILQAAIAIAEVQASKSKAEQDLAPLIAVTRSVGGSGATTLVTHLARRFAEAATAPENCCVIDLDIQFGRVAEVLGMTSRSTLSDLLEAGDRIDAAFLRSVAHRSKHGFSVIAAPSDIMPLESIDPVQLKRIIDCACAEFDFVLLDTPSNLTNWSLSTLARADATVLVVEQTLASLRQARRRLDLFRSVGIDRRSIEIVVNRVERRLFGTISLDDVSETLGQKVMGSVALDAQTVPAAQDQGIFVEDLRPKSQFATDIGRIADQIIAKVEAERRL